MSVYGKVYISKADFLMGYFTWLQAEKAQKEVCRDRPGVSKILLEGFCWCIDGFSKPEIIRM
jgi:hypothetical protein